VDWVTLWNWIFKMLHFFVTHVENFALEVNNKEEGIYNFVCLFLWLSFLFGFIIIILIGDSYSVAYGGFWCKCGL
jgi:hypothetical protein